MLIRVNKEPGQDWLYNRHCFLSKPQAGEISDLLCTARRTQDADASSAIPGYKNRSVYPDRIAAHSTSWPVPLRPQLLRIASSESVQSGRTYTVGVGRVARTLVWNARVFFLRLHTKKAIYCSISVPRNG